MTAEILKHVTGLVGEASPEHRQELQELLDRIQADYADLLREMTESRINDFQAFKGRESLFWDASSLAQTLVERYSRLFAPLTEGVHCFTVHLDNLLSKIRKEELGW